MPQVSTNHDALHANTVGNNQKTLPTFLLSLEKICIYVVLQNLQIQYIVNITGFTNITNTLLKHIICQLITLTFLLLFLCNLTNALTPI